MLPCTLMPFIVVVDKLSQLPVVSCTLLLSLLSQVFLSQSSWSRFKSQNPLWVVFMVFLPEEEVTSSTKNNAQDPLSSQLRHTSQLWNLSVSTPIFVRTPLVKMSLNSFST